MFKVVRLKDSHLGKMLDDPLNESMKAVFTEQLIDEIISGHSVAIVDENQEVYLVAGVKEYWAGRGHIWTMLASHSKYHFVTIFRIIGRWLKEQLEHQYFRLEVSIPVHFEQGKRRALMLGFKCEAPFAPKYLPNGEDVSIYAMVRD